MWITPTLYYKYHHNPQFLVSGLIKISSSVSELAYIQVNFYSKTRLINFSFNSLDIGTLYNGKLRSMVQRWGRRWNSEYKEPTLWKRKGCLDENKSKDIWVDKNYSECFVHLHRSFILFFLRKSREECIGSWVHGEQTGWSGVTVDQSDLD